MNIRKKMPWLDKTGKPLSEKDLRKVTSTWSLQTWEKYLKSLESYLKESYANNLDMFDKTASKIQISTLFNKRNEQEVCKRTQRLLTESINSLNDNQKTIILGLYYFNKTSRELASQMDSTHQSILKTKNRALINLKIYMNNPSLIKCKTAPSLETVAKEGANVSLKKCITKIIKVLDVA